MAGDIQIPNDVGKVVDIKIYDKSQQLYNVLIELKNRIRVLEEKVKELEDAN